jgi:hypothetical protein
MRARSGEAWGGGAGPVSIMKRLLIAGWLALVSGCSGGGSDTAEPPRPSRVPDDNVFSDQVKALERAQAVEKIMLQGAERRRQAIDQQTQ